jgi:hypothetical protein
LGNTKHRESKIGTNILTILIPLKATFQDKVKRRTVAQRQPTGHTRKNTEQIPHATTAQNQFPEDSSLHKHPKNLKSHKAVTLTTHDDLPNIQSTDRFKSDKA